MNVTEFKQAVRSYFGRYAQYDRAPLPDIADGVPECGTTFTGYPPSETSLLPLTARRFACGCGNPWDKTAIDSGSSVVDLGCGAGKDVILAARKTGATGRVMGFDIAPEMIELAGRAVSEAGLDNRRIGFRQADIEDISLLPKTFADLVLANCVLFLCPDKPTVYRNIWRVLRPGGTLVIRDLVLTRGIDDHTPDHSGVLARSSLANIVSAAEHLHLLARLSFRDIQVEEGEMLTLDELCSGIFFTGEEGETGFKPADPDFLEGGVTTVSIVARRPPLS